MNGIFKGRAQSQAGPSSRLAAIAPADDSDLPFGACRALFVGGAGDVSVVDLYGNVIKIASAESQYHPISITRVRATGTTATGLVALY